MLTVLASSLLLALPSASLVQEPSWSPRPVPAEARAYIQSLGDIGDHGRPPERTRLDFSATCDTRHYRIVLGAILDSAHQGHLTLEALEQPDGGPSAADLDQVQAALDGFSEVYSVSLHCWESAGHRYTISGSLRSEDGSRDEATLAIFFDGNGRFDRVVK